MVIVDMVIMAAYCCQWPWTQHVHPLEPPALLVFPVTHSSITKKIIIIGHAQVTEQLEGLSQSATSGITKLQRYIQPPPPGVSEPPPILPLQPPVCAATSRLFVLPPAIQAPSLPVPHKTVGG